jgi:hypothetical protein
MNKLVRPLVMGSSFCLLLILLLTDERELFTGHLEEDAEDGETVPPGRKEPAAMEPNAMEKTEVMELTAMESEPEDNFASRRRRLDQVCEKYRDVFRPEHQSLYREEILFTNRSTYFFIAAERQFSGRGRS